jgi:hypothetical protein
MSTLKVDTLDTSNGTGNITLSRPLSGSGASLTNLPAANLTGTLPALSGASLTNLPAANLTGTLPAISGASLTNLPSSEVTYVQFPATQVASADANRLDDYEEGTFTPTIQDSSLSDSESQVYHSNRSGFYTKVGRTVTCNGYMNINSLGSLTTSDACYLAGFPFTSVSSGTQQAVVSFSNQGGYTSNIFTSYQMSGALEGNRTTAFIMAPNAQTGSNSFTVATLSGGYFSFSVTYFV